MDAGLRDRAEELAREMADGISTQQELSAMLQLLSKTMIERMLDSEMDVHLGRSGLRVGGDSSSASEVLCEAALPSAADGDTAPATPPSLSPICSWADGVLPFLGDSPRPRRLG
ncbi:MAG: hypothetical protein WD894_03845 [Pirellulales bacterium]